MLSSSVLTLSQANSMLRRTKAVQEQQWPLFFHIT